MLVQIPQVLDEGQVAEFRRRLDAADWTDGRETVGAQGARVKNNEQLPDASPLKAELSQAVLAALERNQLFFAAALPIKILPPRFNRYSGGGEYGFHIDGSVMRLGGAEHLRTDLSCTLFLNDPAEYDGGGLVIDDTYGEHEVKLSAGDAILYPASSMHRVEPVTRGVRLASFFWIQSMVRDDRRRALLLEMDVAIQKLASQVGAGDPSLVSLTGAYHNLLRMWAEV